MKLIFRLRSGLELRLKLKLFFEQDASGYSDNLMALRIIRSMCNEINTDCVEKVMPECDHSITLKDSLSVNDVRLLANQCNDKSATQLSDNAKEEKILATILNVSYKTPKIQCDEGKLKHIKSLRKIISTDSYDYADILRGKYFYDLLEFMERIIKSANIAVLECARAHTISDIKAMVGKLDYDKAEVVFTIENVIPYSVLVSFFLRGDLELASSVFTSALICKNKIFNNISLGKRTALAIFMRFLSEQNGDYSEAWATEVLSSVGWKLKDVITLFYGKDFNESETVMYAEVRSYTEDSDLFKEFVKEEIQYFLDTNNYADFDSTEVEYEAFDLVVLKEILNRNGNIKSLKIDFNRDRFVAMYAAEINKIKLRDYYDDTLALLMFLDKQIPDTNSTVVTLEMAESLLRKANGNLNKVLIDFDINELLAHVNEPDSFTQYFEFICGRVLTTKINMDLVRKLALKLFYAHDCDLEEAITSFKNYDFFSMCESHTSHVASKSSEYYEVLKDFKRVKNPTAEKIRNAQSWYLSILTIFGDINEFMTEINNLEANLTLIGVYPHSCMRLHIESNLSTKIRKQINDITDNMCFRIEKCHEIYSEIRDICKALTETKNSVSYGITNSEIPFCEYWL